MPTLYTNFDTGAPFLTGEPGALCAVLKAALVIGTAKPAAGWQIVHEDLDRNTLVITSNNPLALGALLHIDDSHPSQAKVKAYASAGDYAKNTPFGSGYFVKKWLSRIEMPHIAYSIIATDTFFYIWVQSEPNTDIGAIHGFGDCVALTAASTSALMASVDNYYTQSKLCVNDVQTVHGRCVLPKSLYPSSEHGYFGDRSSSVQSTNALFMPCVLYTPYEKGGVSEPKFLLPGLLQPFSQIVGHQKKQHTYILADQAPFLADVIGQRMAWAGAWWWQMDDWGRWAF